MTTKVKSFLKTIILLAVTGTMAIGTLKAQPSTSGKSGARALRGKWFLQPVLNSDSVTGKPAEIIFDPATQTFSGNTGCNSMRGKYVATDSSIVFNENIITTKMMCVGYNEPAFLKNLLRTSSYSFKNGFLVLMVDGQELFRWGRKKPVAPVSGKA